MTRVIHHYTLPFPWKIWNWYPYCANGAQTQIFITMVLSVRSLFLLNQGYTTLHTAITLKNAKLVEILLEEGHANPTTPWKSGFTPLQVIEQFWSDLYRLPLPWVMRK